MAKFWRSVGNGFSKAGRGASKGWQTWSDHRVKVAGAKAAAASTGGDLDLLADLESETLDVADRVKIGFGQFTGLVAPFVLALILALSNGYLFAGLRDFNMTLPVFLAYAAGFTLEAIGLSSVYTASYNLRHGYRAWVLVSFVGVVLMAVISLTSQYAYLEVDKAVSIPAGTIEHIPVLNAFVGRGGFAGNDLFFMMRAAAYHVGEILCAFIISKKGKSLRKLLAQQREVQTARIEMQTQQLFLDFQRSYASGFTAFMQSRLPGGQMVIGEIQQPSSSQQLPESVDAGALLKLLQEQGIDTSKLLASGGNNGNGNGHKKKGA